jgi:death on curing protein
MKYLTIEDIVRIYKRIILSSGGLDGIRDIGGLESAIIQPQMNVFGVEMYPTIAEKAAILAFSLITNHPFMDGNKRIGHASMEVFLILNGFEIIANVDEQEQIILGVAAGEIDKETFTNWVKTKITEFK